MNYLHSQVSLTASSLPSSAVTTTDDYDAETDVELTSPIIQRTHVLPTIPPTTNASLDNRLPELDSSGTLPTSQILPNPVTEAKLSHTPTYSSSQTVAPAVCGPDAKAVTLLATQTYSLKDTVENPPLSSEIITNENSKDTVSNSSRSIFSSVIEDISPCSTPNVETGSLSPANRPSVVVSVSTTTLLVTAADTITTTATNLSNCILSGSVSPQHSASSADQPTAVSQSSIQSPSQVLDPSAQSQAVSSAQPQAIPSTQSQAVQLKNAAPKKQLSLEAYRLKRKQTVAEQKPKVELPTAPLKSDQSPLTSPELPISPLKSFAYSLAADEFLHSGASSILHISNSSSKSADESNNSSSTMKDNDIFAKSQTGSSDAAGMAKHISVNVSLDLSATAKDSAITNNASCSVTESNYSSSLVNVTSPTLATSIGANNSTSTDTSTRKKTTLSQSANSTGESYKSAASLTRVTSLVDSMLSQGSSANRETRALLLKKVGNPYGHI